MPLDPQLGTSGGGLYPATSQNVGQQPAGWNKLDDVPAAVNVPFVPDSQYKVVAARNPAGGIQRLSGLRGQIALRPAGRRAMTSPPTPTFTTAATIASPKYWAPVQWNPGNTAISKDVPTYVGATILVGGTGFPDYLAVKSNDVTGSSPLYLGVSFLHFGRYMEFSLKGRTGFLYVKVNDEYISLTPTTVPNDGNSYYYYVDFGSVALRRIDILTYNAYVYGIYTQIGDSVMPAPMRGPKTVVVGDSFTGGSGSTAAVLNSWAMHMAEYLGWDFVYPSGAGGSGYLAGNTPRSRYAADVVPFAPDVVIYALGFNDYASFSQEQIYQECRKTFQLAVQSLPSTMHIVAAPFFSGGVGKWPASGSFINAMAAILQAAREFGLTIVNVTEQPLREAATTDVLTSSVTAGGSSIFTGKVWNRTTHLQVDNERVEINQLTAGTGPFTHSIRSPFTANHTAGAVITEVGQPIWTGTGRVGATTGYGNSDTWTSSDNVHPTDAGHQGLGFAMAKALMEVLA